MNRRNFILSGAAVGAGAATSVVEAAEKQHFYEARTYTLRNDLKVSRLHDFLSKSYLPALKSSLSGPAGAFSVISGYETPTILLLLQYDSVSKLKANTDLVSSNRSLAEAWRQLQTDGLPYLRYQSTLFKAFEGLPRTDLEASNRSGRVFELRTYQSKDEVKSAAKIEMFNIEEIKIFRDCGMTPVFFGEAVVGTGLPQLTYMLAFDDMGAREKAWQTFSSNSDWNRIRNDPRWADTVSRIHASFWRATAYSEIK